MITSFPPARTSPAGTSRWLRLIGLLGILLVATAFLTRLFHASKITIEWQPHAETGPHAADTASVRYCLENRGPHQIWKDKFEANKFYLLCQVDDGRWGFSSIIKEGDTWIEKTSFIPRSGSWKDLIAYLEKWATRFTGEVPGLLK
jgi:hypothetical protein